MALAALPLASGAEKAIQAVGKAVKADLVVINGQWFRSTRVKVPAKNKRGWKWDKVLVPVEYEFHINPLSIGLGAFGLAAAAGLGWYVWNGIELHSGIGNVTVIPSLRDAWEEHKKKQQLEPVASAACKWAKVRYDGYVARGELTTAEKLKTEAAAAGCDVSGW